MPLGRDGFAGASISPASATAPPAFEPSRRVVQTIQLEFPAGIRDASSPTAFASVQDQSCPIPEESGPSQSPFRVTAIWKESSEIS